MNYNDLKRIAKQNKLSVKNLIVLAPQNDPFYTGTEGDITKASWFSEIWERFGYSTGVHLRRIHYQILSQGDSLDFNGKPYENTERCWGDLNNAAKAARYLGLVPVDSFIDARNPPARVYYSEEYEQGSPWLSLSDDGMALPSIAPSLDYSLEFPTPEIYGYSYQPQDQAYLLEVWCEKSTMNDVLVPICQKYRANYVTGLGFLSITAVQNLIERARVSGKPTRVLYIADFDPAGSFMPQQIARQLEYWLQAKGLDLDIALSPIALTRDQVEQYDLPRIPIKDSDKRATNFEEKHGEGAVELDALEALYPGSLASIVNEAIGEFIDPTLRRRLNEAESEAEQWLETHWHRDTQDERAAFDEAAGAVAGIVDQYRDRLREMAEDLDREIQPHREVIEQIRQAITDRLDGMEQGLPDRPEPEPEPNDGGWLFRSDRDYMTQLRRYKA